MPADKNTCMDFKGQVLGVSQINFITPDTTNQRQTSKKQNRTPKAYKYVPKNHLWPQNCVKLSPTQYASVNTETAS